MLRSILFIFAILSAGLSAGQQLQYLPVQHEGRVKPLDTVARETLLMIHGNQSFIHEGKKYTPIEWLAEVTMNAPLAKHFKLFRVENSDLLALLGKVPTKRHYLSLTELEPHFQEIYDLSIKSKEKQGDSFYKASAILWKQITTVLSLSHSFWMPGSENILQELKRLKNMSSFERAFYEKRYHFLRDAAFFSPLYPLNLNPNNPWQNIGEGAVDYLQNLKAHPEFFTMVYMVAAFQQKDIESFDKITDHYLKSFRENFPDVSNRIKLEVLYNNIQPFYIGEIIYLLVFILSLFPNKFLKKGAFLLLAIGFSIHTGGLITRMLIEMRPPVTNLYSSAIFVGWGIVFFSLIFEAFYKNRMGCICGSIAGSLSLIIAHHLTGDGDTMEVMRAVLDSNFWLSTHVVVITLGYSATFVAGTLAAWSIIHDFLGVKKPNLMPKMVYQAVSLSALFTFTGTILGGIWADQSWGRFWGWDPKENGALLIILWDAAILHARFGGLIRTSGLMAMAVFGNIVTSFSWFGVNMLGVGLHSYGFMDKAFFYLGLFIATQIFIIALGLFPSLISQYRR